MNKKTKLNLIFFLIVALIILFIQCHLSHAILLLGAKASFSSLSNKTFELIKSKPYDIAYFSKDAVWIWIIYVFFIAYSLKNIKPKADEKWRNIEHGSNDFENSEEKTSFIKNKTDEIVPLTNEELITIESTLKGGMND